MGVVNFGQVLLMPQLVQPPLQLLEEGVRSVHFAPVLVELLLQPSQFGADYEH